MTLKLLIDGIDRTSVWRVYESRWTSHAWLGQSGFSEFILEDPTGTILHADLSARKIVEVTEDASGSEVWLYRGRISNKQLGLGVHYAPGHAMRWTIQTEDYNVDLRGIRVINAVRPDETDDDRMEAFRVAFLNGTASTHGEARDSTDLGNTYIGTNPTEVIDLPAETYTDTSPLDVFQRIAEQTGRNFFVYLADDGTGELYYASRQEQIPLADITVVDDAEDEGADGVDIFAAYKTPTAGDHSGQDVYTGGAVRYGDGSYYQESNIAGREEDYDKWETTVQNDIVVNDTLAERFLQRTVSNADESFSYIASIDMRPEDAHRVKAGMMVPLIRKRANKPGSQAVRLVGCTHNPIKPNADGESWYRVDLELGQPQVARTMPKNRRTIPRPPSFTPSGSDAFIGAACSNASADFDSEHPAWVGDKEERVEITSAVNISAGESLIAICTDVDEGHSYDHTVYDESGNTWTKDATSDPVGTPDYRCEIWRCNVTTAIASGDYIRFAFNIGTGGPSTDTGGRCIGVYKFAGALSSPTVGVDNSGFSSSPSLASSAAGDVTVMGMSMADNHAFTGDADWDAMIPFTNVFGSGNETNGVWGQHLKPGAGESWNGTIFQNRDWTLISVGYDFVGGGGSGATSVGAVGGPTDVVVGPSGTYIPAGSVLEHLDITDGGPYHMAEDVTFDPTGSISATNVQDAIEEVASESGVSDHGDLTGLAADDHVQYVLRSIFQAKGDIFVATADDTVSRLAVGDDEQVLTADASQSTGLKWADAASGGGGSIWLPLSTVDPTSGEPELVWDDDDALIPTNVGEGGGGGGGGTTDHGSLSGLGDFDHDQYVRSGGGTYRMVAGILRKPAGTWVLLDDSTHTPLGFASVSSDSTKITVTYSFTAATTGAVVVGTDETWAELYHVGPSVGLTSLEVYITDMDGNPVDPSSVANSAFGNFWIIGIMEV